MPRLLKNTDADAFIVFLVVFLIGVEVDAGPTNVIIASDKSELQIPLATYWFRGHFYVCSKAEWRLLATPHWSLESDEPPLSPRSALLIAEKYARAEITNSAAFRPREIVLESWGEQWFYVVSLETLMPGEYVASGGSIKIPVLFDGTIVEREERVVDPKTHAYVPISGQKDEH